MAKKLHKNNKKRAVVARTGWQKVGDVAGLPLRGLRFVFGKRVGNVAALMIVGGLALSNSTVNVLADASPNANKAVADLAEDVFAGGMKKSFGDVAGATAKSSIKMLNAETDPDRCNKDASFRSTRSLHSCRVDQLRNRGTVYLAAAGAMFLGSHLGNHDDRPHNARRLVP